jgi:hypothetical protein
VPTANCHHTVVWIDAARENTIFGQLGPKPSNGNVFNDSNHHNQSLWFVVVWIDRSGPGTMVFARTTNIIQKIKGA